MNDTAAIKAAFESGDKAFAAWRLPYASSICHISAPHLKRSRKLDQLENIFLLNSFENAAEDCYFIGDAEGEEIHPDNVPLHFFADRPHFMTMAQEAVRAINRKELEKVVISRKKKIKPNKELYPFELFLELEKRFPSAFVSLVRIDGHGIWLGASPELLLSVSKGTASSYALAGTEYPGSSGMGQKEEREQSIVSDYVRDAFLNAGLKDISRIDSLAQSGHLTHFLSRYTSQISDEQVLPLLKNLHPTPAVCGLPKGNALQHIARSETESRGFYSGFLGPYRYKSETQLYVNLRCMQWLDGEAILYGGCGITEASDPASEWRETEEKINVLGKLLEAYC